MEQEFNTNIYFILGSEVASLMQLKNKLIEINDAINELSNYSDDITYHICSHHKFGKSYFPILDVEKEFVFVNTQKEKAILVNKLNDQLIKVKKINVDAKLNLTIINEVEELLEVEDEI